MPIPSTISDLSENPALNSPAGTDQIAGTLDDYLRAIQAIVKKQWITGGTLAAGATLAVPASGTFIDVTGAGTIQQISNSFDGRFVILRFANGIVLQHSGALILPGAVNITCTTNDCGVFVQTAAGTWTCAAFSRSMNADMVDGYHAGNASGQVAVSNGTVCANLNADLLDGQHGAYYADILARLGFTPVRQGSGIGQTSNAVHIGWSAANKLKATVDSTDSGALAFESWTASYVASAIAGKANDSGTYSGLNVGYATSAGNADTLDGWHRDDIRAWGNLTGKPAGADINFNWSGQPGQPAWLWGANDAGNAYVYSPSNFSVASAANASYATNAGNAATVASVTSAQVLAATAAASAGAVGTYVFGTINGTEIHIGGTYAGSSIIPSGVYSTGTLPLDTAASGTQSALVTGSFYLSGTWMAMGTLYMAPTSTFSRATLFLRIA